MDSIAQNFWPELVIGISGSILASLFMLYFVRLLEKNWQKRKYGAASGTYVGYGPTIAGGDIVNQRAPLSNVKISYLSDNILTLVVKEIDNPNEWQGIISMENNHQGKVIWRYHILHGQKVDASLHRFGLKDFVYFPKDKIKTAYLIGDITKGFGDEILLGENI